MIKLDIQMFGGRGASSSTNSGTRSKTYTKGDIRFKVSKNSRGLYDYQSQEYSRINKKWVNMSKQTNFTKAAIQDWLDINVNF